MPATAITDVSALSKIIYEDPGSIEKALVRNKPGLSSIPHMTTFTSGEGMRIPALYGAGQGLATTASVAVANVTSTKSVSWLVPQVKYYLGVKLEGQVVQNAAEGGDESQFIDYVKLEMDLGLDQFGCELSKQLWGTAAGYRGIIASSSIGTDSTITLSNVTDAAFFEVGMWVVLATTATGAIRSGGTTNRAQVSKVNTLTGVITFMAQNLTTLFGAVSTDYVFRESEAQNGAATGALALGLDDWNPPSDPSATLFCGVDRTAFISRLSGFRYNGSSDPLRSVFINALGRAANEVGPGFTKGTFFVNPRDLAAIRNSVEASRIVSKEKMTSYSIGVEEVDVNGIKFVEDSYCKIGQAKMISEGAFGRYSSGDSPSWGKEPLWEDKNSDNWIGLAKNYGNFAAKRVAGLMHITLPALP